MFEAHLAEQASIEQLARFSRKKVRGSEIEMVRSGPDPARWSSDYDSEVY